MSEALNNLRQQITYCERLCEIADYDEITTAVQMGAILQTMRKAQYELAAALGREKELIAWKESMLSVTPPIQEIGQEIGVEWGDTIHDKILPWIKASKERERVLLECVKLYANEDGWSGIKNGVVKNIFIAGSIPDCHWAEYTYPHGYEPAQECKKKVEVMK